MLVKQASQVRVSSPDLPPRKRVPCQCSCLQVLDRKKMRPGIASQRYTAEEIINKLREAETARSRCYYLFFSW